MYQIPDVDSGAADRVGQSQNSGNDNPASGLVIHGIPSNVGAGAAGLPIATSAAMYVDGVYAGIGSTYDLERVEVLRGPQGTLYGRSATSGIVAVSAQF